MSKEMKQSKTTDRQVLTKNEFVIAMKKGWENLDWVRGWFFADAKGSVHFDHSDQIAKACAIGAASYNMKVDPHTLIKMLPKEMGGIIAAASNNAGSASVAIETIEQLEWRDYTFSESIAICSEFQLARLMKGNE